VAVALRPTTSAAYNNLGNALSNQGKADEAIACFHKAIELDPRFALARYNLGVVCKATGKEDDCARRSLGREEGCRKHLKPFDGTLWVGNPTR
jgi:Flp pilus assembly protein TadD